MKVLVLGHKGMLGHMVVKYLLSKRFTVATTEHRFGTEEFKNLIEQTSSNVIVNCIGAIPQKTKDFSINETLPIWLENNTEIKIVHPGTDCEMDDDAYGMSKKVASDYIKENGTHTKIIKASIIGPELNNHNSLLDWYLHNTSESVTGYSDAMWNGVSTLTWAKYCEKLITDWDNFKVETILFSECISKFELLSTVQEVYKKGPSITEFAGKGVDKCLKGDIHTDNIKTQLSDLHKYYYDN